MVVLLLNRAKNVLNRLFINIDSLCLRVLSALDITFRLA